MRRNEHFVSNNYDESAKILSYLINSLIKLQSERICFFFHFFFRNSGASPKREKPEELLELMTKAIQNTGLLWPLRTRSQPRFYFRETRHFETLHEHPKQFDDTVKLPYYFKANINGHIIINDTLILISLIGNLIYTLNIY